MKTEILEKFECYPNNIQKKLFAIRKLIIDVAESNNLGFVEETLKWNEPAYITKTGSTIRFDWKKKTPTQYYLFFNCNTTLVETFKLLYSGEIRFQGNRAIVLNIEEAIKVEIIKKCIFMALNYHELKHLPLLGQPN